MDAARVNTLADARGNPPQLFENDNLTPHAQNICTRPSAMAAPHATHRQTRSPSRSQSPLPPAPVNSAPGPRAQALQKGFSGALGATLKKCNYPNFATCFPTAAQYVPDTLDGLHQQFVAKLEAGCQVSTLFLAIGAER